MEPLSLKRARVTFTGKLASMNRSEAYRSVREAGGEPISGVSRQTTLVVVGMDGWPLLEDGMTSSKLRRAEQLIRQGHELQIISEDRFLGLTGHKAAQPINSTKSYLAEDVCRLLKLPLEALRRWEQFGLVRSHEGLYDFQDLVSLRTLAELIGRGVRPETIARSLQSLASLIPGTDRPLAQLRLVVENPRAILVDLGMGLLTPDGQFLIDFDPRQSAAAAIVPIGSEQTAADWFEAGQVSEEEENYPDAIISYRKAISQSDGRFPEAWYNLGNVLRMTEQLDVAKDAYEHAVAQDSSMACGWYNLADVFEEQGKLPEAVSSLKRALDASPNYADAHFNLALCYEKLQDRPAARHHWTAYLKLDTSSQWARIARRHLAKS